MARPTNEELAKKREAAEQADIRRAIGVLSAYLVERDQIQPHGHDKALYWLSREFPGGA